MKYKFTLAFFAIFMCVLLAACSSGAGQDGESGSMEESEGGAEEVVEVKMTNLGFEPDVLTIKVGTTVTWTNTDAAPHSATSDTGLFDSSFLTKGKSFSFTFEEAGTYPYHCDYHMSTKGTIEVTE